jgi:hypothetical protein
MLGNEKSGATDDDDASSAVAIPDATKVQLPLKTKMNVMTI